MTLEFKNVIFAGGGSRCLWQVGFWDGANRAGLGLYESVDYAASTSAGCAMATACLLGRGVEALELFREMTARNPANIHWQNLRPGSGKPLLPHIEMYREALERFLVPADLDRDPGDHRTLDALSIPNFGQHLKTTGNHRLGYALLDVLLGN